MVKHAACTRRQAVNKSTTAAVPHVCAQHGRSLHLTSVAARPARFPRTA